MRLRERFVKNLGRVRSLVEIEGVSPSRIGAAERGDTLRAAVVFLHSTLEDLLRTVDAIRLPNGSPEVLGRIPFPRPESRDLQRKTTFSFEDLAEYRGKTVDDVVRAAVNAHLDRSNYNNVGDVVALLVSVGLSPELVKPHASYLGAMIARRHSIVHRADIEAGEAGEPTNLVPIEAANVAAWIEATETFGLALAEEFEVGAGLNAREEGR